VVSHVREGEAALAEGDLELAVSAYRAALALAPDDRRALAGVLRAELERGDGESALRALRELETRSGSPAGAADRCAALGLAARARLVRGETAGALAAAREHGTNACEEGRRQPLLARALVAEGHRHRTEGRLELASRSYRAATEADPARADVFELAGRLLLDDGRSDEAVRLLAIALAHHPEAPALRDSMVRALSAPGSAAAGVAPDPGLLFELDRSRYELTLRDLRTGDHGPQMRVVLGSPAHDTPTGGFAVGRVILNPAWHPSAEAAAAGARKRPPSLTGPMGVAKIPFADDGSIALHGGGHALLLGKPVSAGCVRARDADLLRALAWMHENGTLDRPQLSATGEVERGFRRRVRFLVR